MTQPPAESSIDLDAYFERIGYHGERPPTLATLRAIHAQHATKIPFENLSPLLRQVVRLDLASLQEKLVHQGRGGYCFEQNLLLRAVLLALGFQVRGCAGMCPTRSSQHAAICCCVSIWRGRCIWRMLALVV